MIDSRPGNLTLGMKFCVKSNAQAETTEILHTQPQDTGKIYLGTVMFQSMVDTLLCLS